MSEERCRSLFRILVLVVVTSIVAQAGQAQSADHPALPSAIERVLPWLPVDTETLVAANAFKVPSLKEMESVSRDTKLRTRDADLLMHLWAMQGLFELGDGKYLEAFAGSNVVLALRGARNVEFVSKFGAIRDEGCAIIIFEKKVDEIAKGWLGELSDGSKQVRRLAGRDVFVFPTTARMESWVQSKPWQGTFLVLLKPDTLLCATSDRYLEEILKRIDNPAPERALPGSLPEWNHVDPKSASWMLRHVPEKSARRIVSGLTLTIDNNGFRVVYLPVANSAERVEQQVRTWWMTYHPKAAPEIRHDEGGTVVVSSRDIDPFIWTLCLVPGENGNLGSK